MAWQNVYKDKTLLSGPAVSAALQCLSSAFNADRLVVCNVTGSGSKLPELRAIEARGQAVNMSEITGVLAGMRQLVWADFALFASCTATPPSPNDSFEAMLTRSSVVMRCVDNTYLYIYGVGDRPRLVLPSNLLLVEQVQRTIDQLDMPD